MKKSWIIILLILFSLISFGQPGGGQYTIWIYVTFDGSPINNATVKVTNLANGQSDYATYEPSYGDGWYGINLANNIDWDYGDVVLIEAFYNDYYGSNTTVLTTQDYSIVNVSIISNYPPSVSLISPENGSTGLELNVTLEVQISDADGDIMNLTFYNGDGEEIASYSNVANGSYSATWQNLSYDTTYYWYVVVDDGIASTTSPKWHFTTKENSPPSKPTIAGINKGYSWVEYTFNASSVDPEEHKIKYGFDWDNDSNVEEWTAYYESGTNASKTHSWHEPGVYYIKVIAQDEYGAKSQWSDLWKIEIFNIPPTIQFLEPDNKSAVNGSILIRGVAWDKDGIENVEIRIDDEEWVNATFETIDEDCFWQYLWNTTLYKDGLHKIYVRCYDGYNYSISWIEVIVKNEKERPVTTKHIGEPQFTKYDYDDGAVNEGVLVTDVINVTQDVAWLKFYTWWQIEGMRPANYDLMDIYISTDGGYNWNLLKRLNPSTNPTEPDREYKYYSSSGFNTEPQWVYEEIDISAYVPCPTLVIKFVFNTNDSLYNYWEGWYIDDVVVEEFGGNIVFQDDMESGVGNWTYTGYWHLSDHRSHSSSHAWYYGIEHSYVTSFTPFNFTVEGNYTDILYNISNGSSFTGFHPYVGNFSLSELSTEDGLYWLMYYAENDTNSEPIHLQSHYADNTPPVSTYEFGGLTSTLTYKGHDYTAIKSCTPLWINASDGEGAGVEWLNYSVWWNSEEPANFTKLYEVSVHDNDDNDEDKRVGYISVDLLLANESFHEIKWQMVDYLGHENEYSLDIAVDTTPPNISVNVTPVSIIDEILDETFYWIRNSSTIQIKVIDNCVGVKKLKISIYWNETISNEFILINEIIVVDNDTNDIDNAKGRILYNFLLIGDGYYKIKFNATDYLNNSCVAIKKYYIDISRPTAKIKNLLPEITEIPFNITIFDIKDIGAGIDRVEMQYCYSSNNSSWSDWTTYAEYDIPFENRHDVINWSISFKATKAGYYRFRAVPYDLVGNARLIYGDEYDAWCFVNVSISIFFGKPKHENWISLYTPINITCSFPGKIFFRIFSNGKWIPLPGEGAGIENKYFLYDGNFTLAQFNCSHGECIIEFYGNNTPILNTTVMLDALSPYTNTSCPFLVYPSVQIKCNGSDDGCGIAYVKFYYMYSYDNKTWSNWTLAFIDYEFPYMWNFSLDELEIGFYKICSVAVDKVGNEEKIVCKEITRLFTPDFNDDEIVNVQDLVLLAKNFGKENAYFDINGDGQIDIFDAAIIMRYWTSGKK